MIPIILVNYNNTYDTEDCIDSIYKSEGVDPFIIVVDNASKAINSVLTLKNKFPQIHLIINEKNVGFGRANNIGIKWANENLEYDYLFLLNNDTVIEPNTIKQLINAFHISPKIGITTGKIMYYKNREIVWYGGGNINFLRGWPKITDYNNYPTKEGAYNSRFVDFISGCAMMISKECISKIKGFDESFFMYAEDLELSIRTVKKDFQLYYCSHAVIFHKVEGSNTNMPSGFDKGNKNLPFIFENTKINQWKTMKRHLGKLEFWKFNLLFFIENTYRLMIFIVWRRLDLIKTIYKIYYEIIK